MANKQPNQETKKETKPNQAKPNQTKPNQTQTQTQNQNQNQNQNKPSQPILSFNKEKKLDNLVDIFLIAKKMLQNHMWVINSFVLVVQLVILPL